MKCVATSAILSLLLVHENRGRIGMIVAAVVRPSGGSDGERDVPLLSWWVLLGHLRGAGIPNAEFHTLHSNGKSAPEFDLSQTSRLARGKQKKETQSAPVTNSQRMIGNGRPPCERVVFHSH